MLCTLTCYENWRCNLNNGMTVCITFLCVLPLFCTLLKFFAARDSDSVIADVIAKRARFFKVSSFCFKMRLFTVNFFMHTVAAILRLC